MAELKDILAENLLRLRKAASLTQMELAEKLHYSDKSVSKWEHGDAVPDIEVLARIAAFYGVTVDWLIGEHADDEEAVPNESSVSPQRGLRGNRLVITLLAISCVWLISTIVYVQLLIWADINYWYAFIWSVPASCIILIVFNAVWGKHKFSFLYISLLIWTLIAALYLQLLRFNVWPLFFIGIPLQIAVILWAQLRRKGK